MSLRICRHNDNEDGHYWDTSTGQTVPPPYRQGLTFTLEEICPKHNLPKGYRLLKVDEVVREGDEAWTWATPDCSKLGWVKLSSDYYILGEHYDPGTTVPIRRKN